MDFADIGKLLTDGKNLGGLGMETLYPIPPLAKLPSKKAEPFTLARKPIKRKA